MPIGQQLAMAGSTPQAGAPRSQPVGSAALWAKVQQMNNEAADKIEKTGK